jgi:uncharacterized protein YuzE
MKDPEVHYYPETDTMWVILSDQPSVESNEVATNVIVAVDKDGGPVAIEFLGPVHKLFAELIEGAKQAEARRKRTAS